MDWMKYRKIYFSLSAVVIGIGIFSLVMWGLPLGVDFVGGTIAEYQLSKDVSVSELRDKLKEKDLDVQSVTKTPQGVYLLKFPPLPVQEKEVINEVVIGLDDRADELRFELVGASFGPELIQKTIYALAIASSLILIWVAVQFKSIKFGTAAVLAMLHDSLVILGMYSLFGHFFNAEVDFLFVTAVLTVLSFSVHDTIVVYDRISELQRKVGGDIYMLANTATSETMVRSLNNSFTIIFMLLALILLGGDTTVWFAVALLVGSVSGTYSSPFVAVPILVTWEEVAIKYRPAFLAHAGKLRRK